MDRFQKMFASEAVELIDSIEKTLLLLEQDPNNAQYINEAFRSMHSLKGGASMCGMGKLEEITHHFENIYDSLRTEKTAPNKEIINLSFKTLDHFSALLSDIECSHDTNRDNHINLLKAINDSLNNLKNPSSQSTELNQAADSSITFLISLKLEEDILLNGTNPLFLINDLTNIGKYEIIVRTRELPDIEELNPLKVYLFWDIVLVATSINEIKDVFIFIEDQNTLNIKEVCKGNIFDSSDYDRDQLLKQKSFYSLKKYLNTIKIDEPKPSPVKEKEVTKKEKKPTEEPTNSPITKSTKSDSNSSIRVSSDKIDELMNLVSEMVTSQASLNLYASENKNDRLEIISETMEKLSRQLRETAFSMTLVPLNDLFYRFQRLVRDLSNQLGKEVDFITHGGDTDLDKTIIESLTDPMMHLLRNCLDHGIESNEERKRNSKEEKGKIILNAYYSGANVHIQIKDNGKGIDPKKIRSKAIKKELIREDDKLSDQEILNLIFTPGFSTAEKITDVSGRGVGMDVVKRNINSLNGEVHISSELGIGTTVEVILPLTLSIIDGLLVKVDDSNYVIPLTAVKKCFEIEYKTLSNNFFSLLELDGEQVPFLNLRDEFNVPKNTTPEFSQVILVYNEEFKIGICVDEIIGEHQAVLKPVGKYFSNQEYISGGTILGDGSIALVLDTYKIIDKKVRQKHLTK